MNAKAAIAIAACTTLVGFIAGLATGLGQTTIQTPATNDQVPQSAATIIPQGQQRAFEFLEKEIDSLRAQLAAEQNRRLEADEQIKELSAALYEESTVRERIRARPTNWLSQAKLDRDTLAPSKELQELYELSDQQMKDIKALGEQTISNLKAWESQQAILVDESNIEEHRDLFPMHTDFMNTDVVERIRYAVPAAPPEMYASYYDSLTEIAGPAKAFAIERSTVFDLQDIQYARSIDLQISESKYGTNFSFNVDRRTSDGESVSSLSFSRHGSSKVKIGERWQHLFELNEVEPTQ